MVHYYVAYYLKEDALDLSIVIYDSKQPVGVMPLMVHKDKQNGWILSSNGEYIVDPVFIDTLTARTKKRLEKNLADLLFDLANQLNIKQCQFVNIQYFNLSSWYLMWAERAKEAFSTHHLLVDLTPSLDNIFLKFRKSNRERINQGLREFNVEAHEQVTFELFERFRLLHKLVAGRITRPIESWDKQKQQIDEKESFIVTISDKSNNMIGAGLYTYSRDIGYSCVSAYKREWFDKPIGHPVRMKAIEIFKNKGLKWHEMGQKNLKMDIPPPTEKELSISHHKEGFASDIIARQHLIVQMSLDSKK